jgi:hypothetical protein
MTDDRSLERAARSWLESGPTEAPDHAVDAALLRIQTTRQDRVTPILWRLPTMNSFGRLFAGLAAVAIFAVVGLVALRPADVGPGSSVTSPSPAVSEAPTASPSAESSPSATVTPPVAACGLITTDEAAAYAPYGPGTGSTAAGSGSGAVTTCQYTGGDIFLTITLTTPGGNAAFDLVKATPGATVIPDLGADRGGGQLAADGVFDPASVTLYVSRGDALVAIHAGSAAQSSASRLATETTIARIVAGRM